MPSSTVARRWVVNASPLILLSKVGKLDLIDALASEVAIPAAVLCELRDGADDDSSRNAARAITNARVVPDEVRYVGCRSTAPPPSTATNSVCPSYSKGCAYGVRSARATPTSCSSTPEHAASRK